MTGEESGRRLTAAALRWLGLTGILAVAVLRCLTTFVPARYFDVDPMVYPDPMTGVGPAGSLTLDVLLLGAAACGIVGEILAGRAVRTRWFVLALLPAAVVMLHGWGDGPDLWRGMTWLGAVVAMVTAAHLARDRCLRITLIAALLGVLGPLLVRGGVQVYREHPQTIAEFERTKEQFLAARGWEPDSPSTRIYERRLRQARPRGWFVTENVYASFMACGFVGLLGLTLAAVRARAAVALRLAVGTACGAAFVGLVLAGSKGGMLAAAGGAVLATAPFVFGDLRSWLARHGGTVLLAFVAAAILGVVVRGSVLPESFAGERSVLFRWHYLTASTRVLADEPLVGVGPAGFQDAYVRHRPPRNPEEVSSAHNVLLDWLCALGPIGALWGVIVLARLQASATSHPGDDDDRDCSRAVLIACTAVALGGLLPAMVLEADALDEPARLARAGGVVAFILVAALIGQLLSARPLARFGWPVACGAGTLLAHGMIEITFVQPESAAWCLLWFAAAAPIAGTQRRPFDGWAVAAVLIVLAASTWWWGVRPAAARSDLITAAARAMQPAGDSNVRQALQRLEAARLLENAYEAWPVDPRPLEAAAFQALAASALLEGEARVAAVREAVQLTEAAVGHDANSTIALQAGVLRELGRLTGDRGHWDRAISSARELTRRDPHAIGSWRRYGDTLWEAGRRAAAADAYRRALAADRNLELDPEKRLSDRDRELLESRLREADEMEGDE